MLPHKNGNTEDLQIHGYSTEFKSPSPLSYYGSDEKEIKKLIDENESWAQTLSTHTNIIIAQVVWAVRSEMARTAEDVLARRTRVLFFDAKLAISLAPKVAEIMMKELNRDEEWKIDQINTFRELATGYLLNKT